MLPVETCKCETVSVQNERRVTMSAITDVCSKHVEETRGHQSLSDETVDDRMSVEPVTSVKIAVMEKRTQTSDVS